MCMQMWAHQMAALQVRMCEVSSLNRPKKLPGIRLGATLCLMTRMLPSHREYCHEFKTKERNFNEFNL